MFLTKGNDHNLEGKVTIYAEYYQDSPCEPEYIGAYASINPDDIRNLLNRAKCHESMKYNDILQEQEVVDFYEQDFFIADFSTHNRAELPLDKGDVKFAGVDFNRKSAKGKVEYFLDKYIQRYDRQLKSILPEADDYYKNYPGVFLKPVIIDKYITPLIIALKKKNDKLKDAILQRFDMFLGFEFPNEIKPLMEVICNTLPNFSQHNTKLIKYHLNKLVAVCQEDYTKAIYLRDKISKLYLLK